MTEYGYIYKTDTESAEIAKLFVRFSARIIL